MENGAYLEFIKNHGYWLLYFLVIIEGPLTTLIAGSLSALGVMNWFVVWLISVAGDLTMDLILYSFGFFAHKPIGQFLQRHPRLHAKQEKVKKFFHRHGGKLIFFVKISTGLCYLTFITAGMTKMSLRKFLFFSFLGGLIWSGFLVAVGYFYGNLYERFNDYIEKSGLLILSLVTLAFLTVIILKKWQTSKIFKQNNG